MSTPAYRLKINRAIHHVNDLNAQINAFIDRKPYEISAENDVDAGKRLWKLQIRQHVPEALSMIVGDAIHNARATLDLLMVAIVRHCDPTRESYNHVHFIVGDSKEKFESRLPDNIKGASPGARKIIENLKPYKGGDEAFWRLHQLDILDKHKAIIPVESICDSVDVTLDKVKLLPTLHMVVSTPEPFIATMTPARRFYPLQNGTILFEVPLNGNHPFKDEPKFTFEIAFGEGQILDGEPVIPALAQICQFVEGVIDIVETHILN